MLKSSTHSAVRASVGRCFLSILYELLFLSSVLVALAICSTVLEYLFGVVPTHGSLHLVPLADWASLSLQLVFLFVVGFYYTYCWHKSGQTLAMKSWRIRLVCRNGDELTWKRLWMRYFIVFMTFPVNFIWFLVDKDRLFLHDRWCKTMLISVDSDS